MDSFWPFFSNVIALKTEILLTRTAGLRFFENNVIDFSIKYMFSQTDEILKAFLLSLLDAIFVAASCTHGQTVAKLPRSPMHPSGLSLATYCRLPNDDVNAFYM
jgi:hypothetical protein